jgi:threonine dehydratase
MTVLESPTGVRLLRNPLLDRARPYGAAEQAILSLAKAAEAARTIGAWDGYAATPLRSLARLAAAARVGEIAYKDEGQRAPLGSFKMLGGGYAVERLARSGGAANLTVACATDGNHGRAVAWGARRAGCRAVIYVHAHVSAGRAAVLSWFWERDGAARPVMVVVEPDKADCLYRSAEAGRLTAIGGDLDTVMAGLSCGEPSGLAWRLLSPGSDAFMAIPDALAEKTMRDLALDGIVAGESAAAGLAGLMAASQDGEMRNAIRLTETSRVLLFGTEGATDPDIYARIVGRTPEQVSA